MSQFWVCVEKAEMCCLAGSRVACFGLNLHGAIGETQHWVALGAFPAPLLALSAYGQLKPMLSSQK